jgi:hypothetical protein
VSAGRLSVDHDAGSANVNAFEQQLDVTVTRRMRQASCNRAPYPERWFLNADIREAEPNPQIAQRVRGRVKFWNDRATQPPSSSSWYGGTSQIRLTSLCTTWNSPDGVATLRQQPPASAIDHPHPAGTPCSEECDTDAAVEDTGTIRRASTYQSVPAASGASTHRVFRRATARGSTPSRAADR